MSDGPTSIHFFTGGMIDAEEDWRKFSKETSITMSVDMPEVELYFIKFPCKEDYWFKLFLSADGVNVGHVELNQGRTVGKGNVFCGKAAEKWKNFNFNGDWECEEGGEVKILK